MTDPFTPDDARHFAALLLPDEVIQVFNLLITSHLRDDVASFTQEEAVNMLVERGIPRGAVFAKGYLNVESIYKAAGWDVTYDAPGYNETYPATFKFKAK